MKQPNTIFPRDEEKCIALIDTIGQLEAIITLFFDIEECTAKKRLDFYLGMLLAELIDRIKGLVDEMINDHGRDDKVLH